MALLMALLRFGVTDIPVFLQALDPVRIGTRLLLLEVFVDCLHEGDLPVYLDVCFT